MKQDKILINGVWLAGEGRLPVRNKYTGVIMAHVGTASRQQVTDAVRVGAAAVGCGEPSPYQRYVILSKAAELLERRRQTIIATIVGETGVYEEAPRQRTENVRCL
jgi:succinate-semialdehyde dehydrogenase/glutarate-semialdehyde dehydrogenase